MGKRKLRSCTNCGGRHGPPTGKGCTHLKEIFEEKNEEMERGRTAAESDDEVSDGRAADRDGAGALGRQDDRDQMDWAIPELLNQQASGFRGVEASRHPWINTAEATAGYSPPRPRVQPSPSRASPSGRPPYSEGRSTFEREMSARMTRMENLVGRVAYPVKVKLEQHGEVLNSTCECPAGKGGHATCKHVAALLLMISNFVRTGEMAMKKGCTDVLQRFHKPPKKHDGSPRKAEDIGDIHPSRMADPRPTKYKNMEGYNDFVRNAVINYCADTNADITMRYLYDKADLQAAAADHDYCQLPFTEYFVDRANSTSRPEINQTEKQTREQSSCRSWHVEREWRLTASKFGDIANATHRRNMEKLCASIYTKQELTHPAVIHGKQYESVAIEKFQKEHGIDVQPSGLFICLDNPYLSASPDGLVGDSALVEVKCPYSGRDEEVRPHSKYFPFLECVNGETVLKTNCKHYAQIQGQLAITGRKVCYFLVYTFEKLFVQEITADNEYWQTSLLPKLSLFYTKHYRPYVAKQL